MPTKHIVAHSLNLPMSCKHVRNHLVCSKIAAGDGQDHGAGTRDVVEQRGSAEDDVGSVPSVAASK